MREETARPPSTDGREPHTFEEQGPEARWVTEDHAVQYDSAQDVLFILGYNTGNVPIGPGQFRLVARGTNEGGSHTAEVDFSNQAQPGEPLFVVFPGVRAQIGPGPVTLEAYMPPELGGDFTSREIEIT
jgi:hypothetical protein